MINIFEKGTNGEYYVRLDFDLDKPDVFPLASFNAQTVSVIETLMSSTPYMNVKFIDGYGDLMTANPIIPDTSFRLTYGKTKKDSVISLFKLSEINYSPLSTTDTESVLITSDMIHDKWEKMFKYTHSRSWNNKKYSDVVKEVVADMGFDEVIVEDTLNNYNVIQPNWTNSTFLKWLSKNSVNADGLGGYVYYITLDNKFVFSTFDNLYNKKAVKTINPAFRTEDFVGYNFLNIKNNYFPTLNQGGFGLDYTYFDYETKTYIKKSKTVADIKERQLSDWYYIAESHMEPSKLHYGGRDVNTENVVQNSILSAANSVQKIDIYIKGDTELHVGDLINLKVPVAKQIKDNSVINEIYSGHWLIWKVVHSFDIVSSEFTTRLFLTRNGINGKELDGLVKTQTGKSVQ